MDIVQVNDISQELFILNKHTVDKLFQMPNCADCVVLYMFYYKTAKWQKTNSIKAVDEYTRKCLNWGTDKLRKTKAALKEAGLIQIIQVRHNNLISGWFIQVNYLVNSETQNKICNAIKVVCDSDSNDFLGTNKYRNQQVSKPTSRKRETNAYNKNKICLKIKYNMLKNKKLKAINKKIQKISKPGFNKFELFWNLCLRKCDKQKSLVEYQKVVGLGVSEAVLLSKMQEYVNYVEQTEMEPKYINTPFNWLKKKKWKEEFSCLHRNNNQTNVPSEFSMSSIWE